MNSGVYEIFCIESCKSYIGSTVDFNSRWISHKSQLNRGIHPNKHLQNAWDNYGPKQFLFCVLEIVPIRSLIEREQYWIDAFSSSKNGYNISPTAGSCLGIVCSEETRRKISEAHSGKKLSEKTKLKISKALKGKPGTKHSKKTREKISKSKTGQGVGRKHSRATRAKMRRSARFRWRKRWDNIP